MLGPGAELRREPGGGGPRGPPGLPAIAPRYRRGPLRWLAERLAEPGSRSTPAAESELPQELPRHWQDLIGGRRPSRLPQRPTDGRATLLAGHSGPPLSLAPPYPTARSPFSASSRSLDQPTSFVSSECLVLPRAPRGPPYPGHLSQRPLHHLLGPPLLPMRHSPHGTRPLPGQAPGSRILTAPPGTQGLIRGSAPTVGSPAPVWALHHGLRCPGPTVRTTEGFPDPAACADRVSFNSGLFETGMDGLTLTRGRGPLCGGAPNTPRPRPPGNELASRFSPFFSRSACGGLSGHRTAAANRDGLTFRSALFQLLFDTSIQMQNCVFLSPGEK